MKNLFLLFLILFFACCKDKTASNELINPKQELALKNKELDDLNKKLILENQEVETLKNKISDINTALARVQPKGTQDYYRFTPTSSSEINVAEKLDSENTEVIDKKKFNDTLDISDNFFVYRHTAKIIQTANTDFEAVLRDFNQTKSQYAEDFFVRVMTFFNGESLPLENENSKTDIHILIQPTELGYKSKSFVISDFFNVKIKTLRKNDNSIELIFEHGQFPIKEELIIIKPELVKFALK